MDLFTLVGKLTLDMSDMDSQMNKAVNDASRKFSNLGDKMTQKGFAISAAVTAPIIAIGKRAIETAADFETGMSEVAAISGATGNDLEKLTDKAKEMGETTKFSASDSAEALKYMAMAGWKTSDMLNGLEGVLNLAAASGSDLGTTSDIVTDALTAMGYGAKDAAHLADVMAAASSNANTNVELMGETFKYAGTMAGTMGYSMEDLAMMIGLMANSGVKGSMAGTALNAIISRLATNTSGATDCIKGLGVEFYNADGSARSLGDVMDDLRNATRNLTTEQQAELASTIAGEEAKKGLLAILNATQEDYDKLRTAIDGCDGSAKNMADTMNNNLNGQITLLKSQLESLAIQFVTLIMPYLMQGVEWLQKLLEWVSGLDDGTKKMIVTVLSMAAAAGPVILMLGRVFSAIGSIISVGGKLVSGISKLIGMAGSMSSVASTVIGWGSKILGGIAGIGSKIGTVLIPAIAAIPAPVWIVIAVIGSLIAIGVALYKNWDEISAWAKKSWESVSESIGNAVKRTCEFFGNLRDSCKEVVDNLKDRAVELKEHVVQKAKELKENAVGHFTELRDRASEKVSEMKDKVTSLHEKLKQQSLEKVEELKTKAVKKYEELKNTASSKIEELRVKSNEKFHNLKETALAKVEELKTKAIGKYKELKDTSLSNVEEIRKKSIEKFHDLKEQSVAKLEELKQKGITKYEELSARSRQKLQEMKETGVAQFKELCRSGVESISDLASGGVERFDRLRAGIRDKIDSVKNIVLSGVERLKQMFKFDWELPHIKLPHFSISGSFSLNPPSIPSIGVEWYRNGAIMMQPTAFGINPATGKTMVGGEAGAEAVAPIELLMGYIRSAVRQENEGAQQGLTAILSLLKLYLPQISQRQMVLDTGVLVGELAEPMNAELGRIVQMRGRTN